MQPGGKLPPKKMYYTLEGSPIPLKRPRFGGQHVYDPQKKLKFSSQLQLKFQHSPFPLFSGPLKLSVTFYMPIPNRMKKQFKDKQPNSPHFFKPDIDNCVKYLLDCCNDIILVDDAQISIINATKVYSAVPRTEFSIESIAEDLP